MVFSSLFPMIYFFCDLQLDKMINTFAMRVKEWYCWHFPELGKIVTDNVKFAQVVRLIRVKEDFNEVRLPELIEAVDGDESIAEEIMSASGISMGQDIVEADMVCDGYYENCCSTLAGCPSSCGAILSFVFMGRCQGSPNAIAQV